MFKEHFRAVKQNVNLAARVLHYHLELASLVGDNDLNYSALNKTARFWNDFNFMAVQTVIINLAKIFDDDEETSSINQMMRSLKKDLSYFSKENLRARKISQGLTDQQMLDNHLSDAHEINEEDLKPIAKKIREARRVWKNIKPVRDKFYAHHATMSDEARDGLFKNVTYQELEDIIQILLNVCFVLEMAELNGTKPNFDAYEDERPEKLAAKEVGKWLPALVKGYT